MKKTRKDRAEFINHLERKYAKKLQLSRQKSRQDVKNSLRAMRGQRWIPEDMRTESLDGVFRQSSRAV